MGLLNYKFNIGLIIQNVFFRARLGPAGPVFTRRLKLNFKHCGFWGPFFYKEGKCSL